LNVPELLSPAGDWAAMKAAAASGADAVYFGVDAFNARQRAENFDWMTCLR
jgi:putative protease